MCGLNFRNFHIKREKGENLIEKDITEVMLVLVGGTFALDRTSSDSNNYSHNKGLRDRLKNIYYFNDEEKAKELNLDGD